MTRVRRMVCGEEARMPGHMLAQALTLRGPGATWTDMMVDLRCVMEQHPGPHQDIVIDGDGSAVWASWSSGEQPSLLVLLQDCPDPRGCCLWDQHPGGHTADLHDPQMAEARTAADRLLPGLPS